MRLIHFAQALTLILLGITGYLAWEGQQAARGAKRELEHLKKAQAAEEAAKPVGVAALPSAPALPPVTITPPAPGTIATPATSAPLPAEETPGLMAGGLPGGGLTVPKTVVAAEAQGINTNTLTALQQRVLAAKPVAKLKAVVREQGFIVVDAGSKAGLAKGRKFEVRRDSAILARVVIADTVEPDEAVADLDLASIPAGVTLEVGDEIIEPVSSAP
jgi:hypothetical protein